MINVYEYDSDDSTGEWTCGQWLWLICGFTGAALFLLSSPLTRLIGSFSIDGVSRFRVVLMIAGFGFFTSARSGHLPEKFARRARKRTREEMLPGEWEHDSPTHEVAAESPPAPVMSLSVSPRSSEAA